MTSATAGSQRALRIGRRSAMTDASDAEPRRVTVRTVAAAAKVSTATVSRVMSGLPTVDPELAARVRRVAEELAYRPNENARSLALGSLRNIGVLMPDLANSYFHEIIKQLHRAAAPAGFRMLIADHTGEPDDEYAAAADLIGHVDGLVLLSPRMPRSRLRALARESTPVVLVNRVEFGVDLPMIGADSFTAMLAVGAHLVALGHRRVVYLSGNELAWQDRERWRGIQAGRALGLDVTRVECDGTFETSYAVADQTLVHGPTAIICFNDLSALGLMARLRDLGTSVPDDISVVGFDDIPIGRHAFPSLTTLRSPREELGQRAWEILETSLDRQPVDEQPVLLPAPLIIRQSTAPVRRERNNMHE